VTTTSTTNATTTASGLFGALHGIVEQFANAVRMLKGAEGDGKTEITLGCTLRIGPEGVETEEFGSLSGTDAVLQPVAEVSEDGADIVVVAEIPGADANKIACRPSGANLLIEASGFRRYRKDVKLPAAVRGDSLMQTYRNGILEVRLRKIDADKAVGA
jgi:HSP20 family molecular chaperone IbpA